MAKTKFKYEWLVLNYNETSGLFEAYNILEYRQDFIKKLKKKYPDFDEFKERLRQDMFYHYCSKSEFEMIIELREGDQVFIRPWVGLSKSGSAEINITYNKMLDWVSFAKHHIEKQIFGDRAKVDIFNQIDWRLDELARYCFYN